MQPQNDYKNVCYPPGGVLLWILIVLELLTFGIALVVLVFSAKEAPEQYHASAAHLNRTFGAINTVFLLVSGYFMAMVVRHFKSGDNRSSVLDMNWAMLGGLLFLVLKGFEYYEKVSGGFTLGYDGFFNFYWLLTGFHVIHVLVGLVILLFVRHSIKGHNAQLDDVEASAAFWHMCDLIWLLLFPVLYLLV